MAFKDLKKNLKKDYTGFPSVKVALLGDSATQFLSQALRGDGYEHHLDLDIFEADFNQIDGLIMNVSSELYEAKPEFTIIFESAHKLLQKYNKADESARSNFADAHYERVCAYTKTLGANLPTKIVWMNYPEIDDAVFGCYANKIASSFIFQLRKLNFLLCEHSVRHSDFYICDMSSVQNKIGRDLLFSSAIYVNTESVIALDALPIVAERIMQIIGAVKGKIKKCLILDLDNTMWGGVIGDDGLNNIKIGSLGIGKAFTEFQYWVKKLKDRGIILCVCSKNTESIAREPFEKHPDMVLKLSDFAVFKANWDTKVENIRAIQKSLNIGFDSMVFLDDNPFERNMVRDAIPGIAVPELPEDPAEYLEFVYALNLFETASFSTEDVKRTEQYRIKSQLEAEAVSFANEDDFLKTLNMVSDVQHLNEFSIPRIAQLSQRSNQFNLRTVRYDEESLKKIVESDRYITYSFTLTDKYGDNGTIGAIILERKNEYDLFIDSWFMSCRVLKRGMEALMLNTIANYAARNGFQKLIGEYKPTEKNGLVRDHYANLGFKSYGELWELEMSKYHNRQCFITQKGL